MRPWAPWVHIVTNVSHLLLVVNGSVNSLIYCSLSSRFRAQVVRLAKRARSRVQLRCGDENDFGGRQRGAARGGGGGGGGGVRRCSNAGSIVVSRREDDDASVGGDAAFCLLRRPSVGSAKGLTTVGTSGSAVASPVLLEASPTTSQRKASLEMRNGLTQTTQV